tara:strand:- start:68 stop:460 length:393 start_codon:yes stop_codon:yes gene_type:complete
MFGIFKRLQSRSTDETQQDKIALYDKASIAHSSFLRSLDADVNDQEFLASAFGAIDGTIQALNISPDHVQMLAMGSTFALRRLSEMERLQSISPAEQGDQIGKAMMNVEHDHLKAQSGQVAYTIVSAMPK